MALPDYSDLLAGTPVEWSTTGGKLITLTSLASGSAREGAKSATWVDATYGMPELIHVRLETKMAGSPTNGAPMEVYVGESSSSTALTGNPGGLTGSDAAYGTSSEKKLQLRYVGQVALSQAIHTAGVAQAADMYFKPLQPYCSPAVVNNGAGVANSATAGDHKLIMTPLYRRIKD